VSSPVLHPYPWSRLVRGVTPRLRNPTGKPQATAAAKFTRPGPFSGGHLKVRFSYAAAVDKVRWGIIGVGNVTERKSGPGFQLAERSELVAVMRRNADLAADYARRHSVPRWYDDAEDLINDPEVDAVYVATPPNSHREYAVRVAQAGKPVYVEKPMGRTALECEEMISACERAGVGLFVAYYRRSLPRFATVKELLEGGRIGQLRSVSIRNERTAQVGGTGNGEWRVDPEISGGGYFVDLGSHILDLLDWLLGPATYAAGVATDRGGRYRAEDLVTGVFTFSSGVEGVGVWNYDSFQDKDRIEIIGTAGALHFSCFGGEPLLLLTGRGPELIEASNPEIVQLPLIQTVVNTLTGHGESPSTGHSAVRTARVIDGLLSDYRKSHGINFPPAKSGQ
jgi:predicted dehydrogenase